MPEPNYTFDIMVLLSTVATMFLLLIVGYAARKLGIIDDKLSKGLSNLIICVGQPFMIINAVLSIEYSPENFKTGMFILLLGVIIHALTAAIALGSTFFIKNVDERSITEFGLLFSNCGFMGFPILKSMFGDIGLFWGSFYLIIFNVATWTYGMYILHNARPEIKMNFVKMILNYGTTPCIIGLLIFVLRLNLPDFMTGAVSYLGSLCTPISMLIIGGLLATIPLKKLFISGKVYYSCAIRLIVVPLAVIALTRICGLSQELRVFSVIMAAVPTAANSSMFAERYDLMPVHSAHIVGMSTLLSAATIPLMVMLTLL